MLGGCHSLNGMGYQRGNIENFDSWERAGNPSWGYKDVFKYFMKIENMTMPELANRDGGIYHSTKGPLKLNSYHYNDPAKKVLRDAAVELGYKELVDINGGTEYVGVVAFQGTLDGTRRLSTAKAYLVPSKNKTNLHVLKETFVTKVLFDKNKTARGVEIIFQGERLNAYAKKEVILSAGTVGSPMILMHSGIGPAIHLKSKNIPVVADLPVGKNFKDHVVVGIPLTYNKSAAIPSPDNAIEEMLFRYITNDLGDQGLTFFDLFGFFNTTEKKAQYPDIEVLISYFKRNDKNFIIRHLRDFVAFDDDLIDTILEENKKADTFIFNVILEQPKSTGEILLRSKNVFDRPIIRPNYLDKKEDMDTLKRGLKLLREFIKTKAFKDAEMEEIDLKIPSCQKLAGERKDECLIRQLSTSYNHLTSTCKMGPDSDKTSVVDPRLNVKRVNGLRVADASIMPNVVSAHINAATIMIAEKAADFIKEDWEFESIDIEIQVAG